MRLIENEKLMEAPLDMDLKKNLERLRQEDLERKEVRPTIIPKAKFYRRAIDISMFIACVSAIVMLILILVAVSTRKGFDPRWLIYILGCTTMVSIISFFVFIIKKHFFKKKLIKIGMYIPFEYD